MDNNILDITNIDNFKKSQFDQYTEINNAYYQNPIEIFGFRKENNKPSKSLIENSFVKHFEP